jgi:hypothetical protein
MWIRHLHTEKNIVGTQKMEKKQKGGGSDGGGGGGNGGGGGGGGGNGGGGSGGSGSCSSDSGEWCGDDGSDCVHKKERGDSGCGDNGCRASY